MLGCFYNLLCYIFMNMKRILYVTNRDNAPYGKIAKLFWDNFKTIIFYTETASVFYGSRKKTFPLSLRLCRQRFYFFVLFF